MIINYPIHSSVLGSKGFWVSLLICTVFSAFPGFSQNNNENCKWFFGIFAGLDFMNSPPTALNGGMTIAAEGASSMADASGNLLFYTGGDTIYNQAHQIMANGTGLLGEKSSTQAALIVKQPGNNTLYYVFTTDAQGNSVPADGLRYSIVDMSLAAGMGSVTVKNVLLSAPTTEKLTGTMHCNGQDIWIVGHEYGSNNFNVYLLTAAGLSAPVPNAIGYNVPYNGNQADFAGAMKLSPGGKKLAMTLFQSQLIQLFDFDNSTGILSNPLTLTLTPTINTKLYGCEFSPDGTKLYGGGAGNTTNRLIQWNLCAASSQAIVNSAQVLYSSPNSGPQHVFGGMQLGPDGKIYIAKQVVFVNQNVKKLSVIHNPNAAGSSCNYTDTSLTIAPGYMKMGIPNLLYKHLPLAPFVSIGDPAGCTTVSFTAPSAMGINPAGSCAMLGYSLTSLVWNFGDPASGSANTSTLANPVHVYSGTGTFVPQLSVAYSCGGGSAVLTQTIVINPINLSVANHTLCTPQSVTLTASGASTYSWNTVAGTSSLVVSPPATTVYTVTGTTPLNVCVETETVTVTVIDPPALAASDKTIFSNQNATLTP